MDSIYNMVSGIRSRIGCRCRRRRREKLWVSQSRYCSDIDTTASTLSEDQVNILSWLVLRKCNRVEGTPEWDLSDDGEDRGNTKLYPPIPKYTITGNVMTDNKGIETYSWDDDMITKKRYYKDDTTTDIYQTKIKVTTINKGYSLDGTVLDGTVDSQGNPVSAVFKYGRLVQQEHCGNTDPSLGIFR